MPPPPCPDAALNLLPWVFPSNPSHPPPFLQPVQRDRTFQTERENGKIFKGHR